MKKSFKFGVCKVVTTIACAAFMFAGIMGIGSITAKAATTNYSVDLSNGRIINFDLAEANRNANKSKSGSEAAGYSKDFKDSVMIAASIYLYGPDKNYANKTSVLSKSPYQAITNTVSGSASKFGAAKNSVGSGTYVISKDVYVDRIIKDTRVLENMKPIIEESARNFIKDCEAVVYGKEGAGDSVFVVNIIYSALPLQTSNKVNGAATYSFTVGSEFVADCIKYRVISTNGNLSAVGLTTATKTVTVPDAIVYSGYTMNVTDIAQFFIKGNKKVRTVTIGKNVTNINKQAFWNCKKLSKVKIKSTKVTSFGKKAFGKDAKNFYVKIPKSCKNNYTKLFTKAGLKTVRVK